MSEDEKKQYDMPPFDILNEILKRLPIKSLIRFTSVSKSWKSIIRSSRFIADYNKRIIQPHHLSFVSYDHQNYVDIFDDDDHDDISFLQRLTLPTSAEHPDFEFYKLIGYSQGLFGFLCYNNNDNVTPRNDLFVIWNPSIKKAVFIPVPDFTHFGFTVCNETDPAILKITYIPWLQVEMFTLSTGTWRNLSKSPPRESFRFTRVMVVTDNRFIHWIVFYWTPEGDLLNNLILSFDITSEQFTESCLPPALACCFARELDLSKLRESLVVLQRRFDTAEIGVWMMMMEPGVENSFTKLYTLNPPYTREFQFPSVAGFTKNGQPIIYSHFPVHKRVLLFYESDLECFNDIEISGNGYPSTAGSYMETLLLLDH